MSGRLSISLGLAMVLGAGGFALGSFIADEHEGFARSLEVRARNAVDDADKLLWVPPVRLVDAWGVARAGELVELHLQVQPRAGRTVWLEDAQVTLRSSSERVVCYAGAPPTGCLTWSSLRDEDRSVGRGIANGTDLVELRITFQDLAAPPAPRSTLEVELWDGQAQRWPLRVSIPSNIGDGFVPVEVFEPR
jgi:hypothetical protein